MTKTEFFILWVISIGIYFLTFQISLILSAILNIILIIAYVYHKKNYVKNLNEKINNGEFKYYEFQEEINKLELFALPIIYLILNILLLFKIMDLNADLVIINLVFVFVPCISMFILKYRYPEFNNGLIIRPENYQNGLTGSKIKKIDLKVSCGNKESELIIENNKTGKKETYIFDNTDLVISELKNIA